MEKTEKSKTDAKDSEDKKGAGMIDWFLETVLVTIAPFICLLLFQGVTKGRFDFLFILQSGECLLSAGSVMGSTVIKAFNKKGEKNSKLIDCLFGLSLICCIASIVLYVCIKLNVPFNYGGLYYCITGGLIFCSFVTSYLMERFW